MKAKLLITFLLFSVCAFSQETIDCYISQGDTIRQTKWYNLESKKTYLLNFRLTRINSDYILELKYHFGENGNFKVKQGDSVWIKFTNGAYLTLFAIDSAKSKKAGATFHGDVRGLVTPGVWVKYSLTQSDFAALMVMELEKFRIFTSRGFDNIPINRIYNDYIKRVAGLLIQPREDFKVRNVEPEIPEEQKTEDW